MKILFIYKEYKNRRKMYGKMMENLGHTVSYLFMPHKTKSNQIHLKHIKKANPDLIWLLTPFYISCNGIDKEAMDYIKSKKIPMALYGAFDGRVPYTECLDSVWRKIDYLFVYPKEMAEWLNENGVNAHYMPLGFYPSQYYKKRSEKVIDVSFMGNAMGCVPIEKDKRARYLNGLRDYNIRVYGNAFHERLKGIRVEDYKGHEKQLEIYSKTKINLEFPFVNSNHPFYYGKYSVKNRLFEIPATCNFILTVRDQEFLDLFGDDTIGYYDDNIESLRENIDRYLKDVRTRKDMAARAYNLVHQKYTFQHLFKRMFEIIES